MLDRLPISIRPVSFSERGKTLSGVFEISVLNRLSDMLQDTSGIVEIDVSFEKEGRVPTIQGNIKTNLKLECQVCLSQLELSIDRDFKLGFVTSLEQADRLTKDCEPFIMEDDNISLVELIEDEVLLALPDIPKHDYECVKRNDEDITIVDDEQQLRSDNPFSILVKLKNTGD